jgi:hydroxymethylpyrimidine/phosphomethylpyrimidine kinase
MGWTAGASGTLNFPSVTEQDSLNIAFIGGTDSSGGAGIAADRQTVLRLGHFPVPIISAITLQNGKRNIRSFDLPEEALRRQLYELTKIPIHGLKIGMLPDAKAVKIVAELIRQLRFHPVVLDPVLLSSSGHFLIDKEGWDTIRHILLPLVDLVTPNLEEAKRMPEYTSTDSNMCLAPEKLANNWLKLGVKSVLIKGGHAQGKYSTDFLFKTDQTPVAYRWKRINGGTQIRGTGCRLASAITCHWAQSADLEQSINNAGVYLQAYIHAEVGLSA